MCQKMPPKRSSVYLLEELKPNGCDRIPAGTVGIVQEHCSEDEIQVEFKLGNTAVTVKVAAEKVKKKFFTVLAIDGGGIRGIIPALILARIEQRMENLLCDRNEKCQLRIADVFDLIAGTSTGGIIALALTKPDDSGKRPEYTAKRLVDLYLNEGKNIFCRPKSHRVRSVCGWLNKKYPADGIQKVLEEYFGSTRLDQALTRVLIPTYDMRGARVHLRKGFDCRRGGHPRFFKSHPINDKTQASDTCQQQSTDCPPGNSDLSDSRTENHLMRDVARATSAAPTYFEPIDLDLQLPDLTLIETLVDGGIFANNPAMCAYADAKRIIQSSASPNDQILLVSIGTGNLTGGLKAEAAKNWGKLCWVDTLITMIFDGASDTVNYQLEQLIPRDNYHRFQPQLTFGQDEMDDATRGNLLSLKALASTFIETKKCALNTISERLMKNRPLTL